MMKVQNTAKSEGPCTKTKKKKYKKQKRKHAKAPQSKLFEESKFDLSSDEGTSDSNNLKIALTPSKSERDNSSELEISCNLNEESFSTSSISETGSFSYNSIIDEFANEGDEKSAKIVASPVISKKYKIPLKSKQKDETPPIESPSFVVEVQHYDTDDGVIVILEQNQTIYFHGLMLMSVVHGEVEILGHTITKNHQNVKLYSPRGTSLLYITNVTTSDVPVTHLLDIPKNAKFGDKCAIILCKKLNDPSIAFIEKHVSQQILPRDESHLPRAVFQPQGSWNLLKPNENWNDIINQITKSTRLMICGGKGVGKTTFLRYAINKLLTNFQQVRIIDLDPGQSEFTIPGCISIVKVNEPVFGVNYTHLKSSEISLLSNINIGYEPNTYLATIRHLLKALNPEEIPTLINYMGYTHGIGINILSATIMHIKPTDVLQIESLNPKNNFKCKLTPQIVKKNAKLFIPSSRECNYNLHQVYSMCDDSNGWTAQPRQLREMCILAYISRMIDSNSIFNSKLPLYKADLSAVAITDLKGETISPAAINGGLIALCSLEEASGCIYKCLGWGIVRGIDLASNTVVILTLQEFEMLEQVSHLVLSSVNLPPSLHMTPDEVTGQIPYVVEGTLMSLGQIPKRSRISVKN